MLQEATHTNLQDLQNLRELVQRLHEGIYVTTRSGEILDANPAFMEMIGVSSLEELRQYSCSDFLVNPEARAREVAMLDAQGTVRDFELQIRRPDGTVRTFIDSAFAVPDARSGETVYQGILVDITERKKLEEQLLYQSLRDPLTGCYNRRYLHDFERHSVAAQLRWGCIMLDVDHFKEYNDHFGHRVGDEVLVRVSRFLMRQTRAEEGVVRLGGDEFCVLLAASDEPSIERAAMRVKQAGARELPIAFSLGWAARAGDETLEATLNRADDNLLAVRSQDRSFEDERRRT